MRRRWIPVVCYVAVIFALSSIQRPQQFLPGRLHDKILHVIEYGVLGFLLMRAFLPPVAGFARAAILTLITGTAVGVLDELYQRSVPGRYSTVTDVVADSVGLAVAVLALSVWSRRRDGGGSLRAGGGRSRGGGPGNHGQRQTTTENERERGPIR